MKLVMGKRGRLKSEGWKNLKVQGKKNIDRKKRNPSVKV